MPDKIAKRQHPQVRFLKSVRGGDELGLLFVEGLKLIDEALRSGLKLKAVFATDTALNAPDFSKIVTASGRKPVEITPVSDDVMEFVSDVDSPPGVIAVAEKSAAVLDAAALAADTGLWVVVHGIQIPNNVGAIMRAAEAAGVSGLFVTAGSSSPFGPKALRASSGSAFRLPIAEKQPLGDLLKSFSDRQVTPVFADARATQTHTEFDWKQ
jgi:TrmH family RNA methyltransferase